MSAQPFLPLLSSLLYKSQASLSPPSLSSDPHASSSTLSLLTGKPGNEVAPAAPHLSPPDLSHGVGSSSHLEPEVLSTVAKTSHSPGRKP